MIFDKVAILFNLLSIMVFSVLFIIFTLSVLVKCKSDQLSQYSISSRRRVLWFIVLSPWFFGFLAAFLAIISGSPIISDSQYFPFLQSFDLHHYHSQEFNLNSWHGISMILSAAFVTIIFSQKTYNLIMNHRQIKLLHALAERDENNIYQLEADASTAFTAGYWLPRCYITSALRQQLTSEEYTIVQLHEKEHARRGDPLKKWIFQLFTSFFPKSISKKLNQVMSLVMEQCADLAVTNKISDKSLIAQTLIKVSRLAVKPFDNGLNTNAVCHYSNDNIEERISYLLSEQSSKALPIFTLIFIALATSVFCALTVDIFHHTIEYSLSH